MKKSVFVILAILLLSFISLSQSEMRYGISPSASISLSDMQRDITIVEGILQKAFQANMPQGIYLDDYGLVFICQVYKRNNITAEHIKNEAWRIMTTYFPTIRGIKSNDWIVLQIKDPNRIHNPQNAYPTIQLRINKSDLNDYVTKKISEKALLERAQFEEIR